MITLGSLLTHLLHKKLEASEKVESALFSQFKKVRLDMTLGQLTYILNIHHFALVIHSQIECKLVCAIYITSSHKGLYLILKRKTVSGAENEEKEREIIIGVVTQIDLLNYITGVEEHHKVLYGSSL